MLRLPSIFGPGPGRRRVGAIVLAAAVSIGLGGPALAQATTQSVAQLVAAGYQILSFSAVQGGYTALLVNYREETPSLLLCNLNLNPDTRQMVTSGCFEVR